MDRATRDGLILSLVGFGLLGAAAYALRSGAPAPSAGGAPPSGGCTSDAQCGSGYVCVNGACTPIPSGCSSSSQCPSGYSCENGSCVPASSCGTQGAPCSASSGCCSGYSCVNGTCTSCPTGSCPCNEFWDTVSCSCQPLVPSVLVAGGESAQLTWLVEYACTTPVEKGIHFVGAGAHCPTLNLGICSTSFIIGLTAGNSSAFTTLNLSGRLTDSAGNGICNTPLTLSYPSTYTYSTTDGMFIFEFEVAGPGGVTTGGDGSFEVNITYTVTLTYANGVKGCIPIEGQQCYTYTVPDVFQVNIAVANDPEVSYPATFNVSNLICGTQVYEATL